MSFCERVEFGKRTELDEFERGIGGTELWKNRTGLEESERKGTDLEGEMAEFDEEIGGMTRTVGDLG